MNLPVVIRALSRVSVFALICLCSAISAKAQFIHTATSANTAGNVTYIDNPYSNNRPDRMLMVTQSWSPHRVYNNNHIGVWYDFQRGRWGIFNESRSPRSQSGLHSSSWTATHPKATSLIPLHTPEVTLPTSTIQPQTAVPMQSCLLLKSSSQTSGGLVESAMITRSASGTTVSEVSGLFLIKMACRYLTEPHSM